MNTLPALSSALHCPFALHDGAPHRLAVGISDSERPQAQQLVRNLLGGVYQTHICIIWCLTTISQPCHFMAAKSQSKHHPQSAAHKQHVQMHSNDSARSRRMSITDPARGWQGRTKGH